MMIMMTIMMMIKLMVMTKMMMTMMVKTKLIVHLPRPDTKPLLLDCLLISPHQEGYDNDEEVICINYELMICILSFLRCDKKYYV